MTRATIEVTLDVMLEVRPKMISANFLTVLIATVLAVSVWGEKSSAIACEELFVSMQIDGVQDFSTIGGHQLMGFAQSPEGRRGLVPFRTASNRFGYDFFVKTMGGLQKYSVIEKGAMLELRDRHTSAPESESSRIELKLSSQQKRKSSRWLEYSTQVYIEDGKYDLALTLQQTPNGLFSSWRTTEIFVRLRPALF